MDILKPDLEWIDGRCYRKFPIENKKLYNEEEIVSTNIRKFSNNEEEYDIDLPIKLKDNRFFIEVPVAQEFIKYIKGRSDRTKQKIEGETAAEIKISHQKDENFEEMIQQDEIIITIIGQKKSAISRAYHRVDAIMSDVRWNRLDYTHFISIPLNNESIKENFLKFKKEILSEISGNENIDEHTFENPKRLHLTIAMLTLLSKREKEKAAAILQKLRGRMMEWLDGKPLDVEVKGVEYMNDDPKEVTVLYGRVVEKNNNCLQLISDLLSEELRKADLSKNESADELSVKLHATLMKGRRAAKGRPRRPFDASRILKKYSSYSFGCARVTDIHISARFTSDARRYWIASSVLQL